MREFPLKCDQKCEYLKWKPLTCGNWLARCKLIDVEIDGVHSDEIRYVCPLEEILPSEKENEDRTD